MHGRRASTAAKPQQENSEYKLHPVLPHDAACNSRGLLSAIKPMVVIHSDKGKQERHLETPLV